MLAFFELWASNHPTSANMIAKFTLKEFLIGSKGIFKEQSVNRVSNHEHTSVGQVFFFFI
jgi:hypothetical protein